MFASRIEMNRPSKPHACGKSSVAFPRWMTRLIASKRTACVTLFLLTFLVTSCVARVCESQNGLEMCCARAASGARCECDHSGQLTVPVMMRCSTSDTRIFNACSSGGGKNFERRIDQHKKVSLVSKAEVTLRKSQLSRRRLRESLAHLQHAKEFDLQPRRRDAVVQVVVRIVFV